jgi:hypothetical protein
LREQTRWGYFQEAIATGSALCGCLALLFGLLLQLAPDTELYDLLIRASAAVPGILALRNGLRYEADKETRDRLHRMRAATLALRDSGISGNRLILVVWLLRQQDVLLQAMVLEEKVFMAFSWLSVPLTLIAAFAPLPGIRFFAVVGLFWIMSVEFTLKAGNPEVRHFMQSVWHELFEPAELEPPRPPE